MEKDKNMSILDHKEELISIIVPVYKVEKYLDFCIQSIVNQTYRNLEIILVDDGSPDNCPRICDEWAQKDQRITAIHKENGGLMSAWMAGVRESRGEYLCFVDSDDWVEQDMLISMAVHLTGRENEIVVAATEYGTHIHASVERGNVFACQFHPEKSSDVGLKILKNFLEVKKEEL